MNAALRNIILFQPGAIQWQTGGLYSATPAYTSWGTSNSVLTRNMALSPDKKLNGMIMAENAVGGVTHGGVHTNIAYTQTAIPYVHTVYIKRFIGERNTMMVMFNSAAAVQMNAKINLGTGDVLTAPSTDGSWTAMSMTTTRLSSGWIKIQFYFTGISDTSMWFVYRLVDGINETYTGDGASSIAVWGTDLRAA